MRASSGGWVENSIIQRRPPPAIFIVASAGSMASTSCCVRLQPAQRGNHVAAAGERRGAGVGAELAGAREPRHHHRAEDAERDVEHDA